jgi:nicotinamidase-related amidase
MIQHLFKKRRKRILIDVNTRKDFFQNGSGICVLNPNAVLLHIRRIVAWARHESVPVISIICEIGGAKGSSKPACRCPDSPDGRKKARYTLLDNYIVFPADDSTHFPPDVLRRHRQIILNSRGCDPFNEPRIERMLTEVKAAEFVLVGAGTEGVVEATALGLLHRGKKVVVVADAVGSWNKDKAKLALRKMRAKGAKLVVTKKLAGTSHLRMARSRRRETCSGKDGDEKPLKIGAGY